MKKTFRLLTSFLLLLTTIVSVFGQDIPKDIKPTVAPFSEGQGYLTLGLDVGLSYQSSDVKSAFGGYGVGLTLEKNLKHTAGNALDLGMRGRLMYARSAGYDLTASTGVASNPAVNGTYNPTVNYSTEGSYFANHRTDQAELGLEAVLTLNRLREKTGVYATLFGGFGLNYYDVKIDQLDGSGKKYNYSTLKPTTAADVKSFLDGTFESKAEGSNDSANFVFMPNLGLEIGYHFSPRFMVVLGHKVTFTKTDLFDGQQWLDKTNLTAKPDFHHYTNLQFKWIIGERKRQHLDGDPPKITFLQPRLSPFNTYDVTETVRAEVLGVTFSEDVTMTINGMQSNFTFKNNELTSDVLLKKGINEIVVKGENQFGSKSAKLIINVLDKQRLPDPPVVDPNNNNSNNNNNNPTNNNPTNPTTPTVQSPRVTFTTPSSSYSETSQNRQAIRVLVTNVSSAQDITMTVNGRNVTDFRFSYGELTYDAFLNEGNNTISVSATNMSGSNSNGVTVNYRRDVPPAILPAVRITTTGNPAENSYGGCQTTIEARVANVTGQRDITMTVNGRATTDFSYNASSGILRANVTLASGSNQIVIRARNTGGEGTDRADVNCTQRQRNPPTIRIAQPTNNSVTEQNVVDVRANTTNIDSKNQIVLYINGAQTSDFNFSTYDRSVTTRMNLNQGDNTVRISVSNVDGSNEDIIHVTYRPRAVSTPPRVTITQPISGMASKTPTVDFQANTSGITNRNQIQITQNYKAFTAFNFEPTTGIITARMTLDAGTNTINVSVSNESGTNSASTTASYSKPVVVETARPPRISILRPADGTTVTTPSVLLEAQAENASAARNEVKVILNGTELAAVMNVMRQIRQPLILQEGINTITVRATTKDGTDEKTIRLTYSKTPTKTNDGGVIPTKGDLPPTNDSPLPTITNFNVTQPVTDPFDPKPLVSVVTATLTKTPKAYIQFKVNGEAVTAFQFDGLTGQFRYSFPVKSGQSYTFYIRAANIDGQVEKTETVKF